MQTAKKYFHSIWCKKIGKKAFNGCESLEEITIPDSVTRIGEGAFQLCNRLKSILIPFGIKEIGKKAFNGCESLEELTIPDSVTRIGEGAFFGCCGLKSVKMPNSILPKEYSQQTEKIFTSEGEWGELACIRKVTMYSSTLKWLESDFASLCNDIELHYDDDLGSFSFAFCNSLSEIQIGQEFYDLLKYKKFIFPEELIIDNTAFEESMPHLRRIKGNTWEKRYYGIDFEEGWEVNEKGEIWYNEDRGCEWG